MRVPSPRGRFGWSFLPALVVASVVDATAGRVAGMITFALLGVALFVALPGIGVKGDVATESEALAGPRVPSARRQPPELDDPQDSVPWPDEDPAIEDKLTRQGLGR